VDIQRTITGDRVSYSGVVCSLYFTWGFLRLGYDAMSLGTQFRTFRNIVATSFSRVELSNKSLRPLYVRQRRLRHLWIFLTASFSEARQSATARCLYRTHWQTP
jgi:hypothetical protein